MAMRGFPDYRGRAKLRRFLFSKTVAVLLAGAFVLIAQAAWGMYERSMEAAQKRDRAAAALDELMRRKEQLREDIGRLSSPRGIEEEIRTRFMVVKDGEKVLVVPEHRRSSVEGKSVFVPDSPSFFESVFSAVGLGGRPK